MLQCGSLRPAISQTSRFVCLRTRCETRNKSITAAIERGRTVGDRDFDRRRPPRGNQASRENQFVTRRSDWNGRRPVNSDPDGAYGNERRGGYKHEVAPRQGTAAVESLPYTTAASEFIYGYSSVLAAVKANRRKLYKLYMHTRGSANAGKDLLLHRASASGIQIKRVGDDYLQAMDKASSGRPHNVCSMETSQVTAC